MLSLDKGAAVNPRRYSLIILLTILMVGCCPHRDFCPEAYGYCFETWSKLTPEQQRMILDYSPCRQGCMTK